MLRWVGHSILHPAAATGRHEESTVFRSVLRAVTSSRTTLRLAGDSAAQRSGKSRARQAIEMLGLRARGYNADD